MNLMRTMTISNGKIGMRGNVMRTKEKHNGLMDKIITVLYWENTSDMYIQRYMGLFNRNHNDVLENHGEKEETGRRTITEPTVV